LRLVINLTVGEVMSMYIIQSKSTLNTAEIGHFKENLKISVIHSDRR